MYKVVILVLAVFGAANAGVVGVGHLGLAGVGPLGLAGINTYGLAGVAPLGLAGVNTYGLAGVAPLGLAGVNTYGLAGVAPLGLAGVNALGYAGLAHGGLLAPASVVGPFGAIGASGAVASNLGGTVAAAVPGINIGADQVGPKTAATVVGVQTVLNGPSATLIASTGAVKGAAQAGANLGSIGAQVVPSAAGGAIPASAVAIQKVPVVVKAPLAGFGTIW